ncbi:molybdopterin-dependent oxidoreductase [Mycolicibacterium sp. CAU 1645]|uniref:Molybdopterin-dependent oxidoreductase n=1 Tax=Mycolicibacterium arenosum TaxID=2952157 RepID=A0ABT1MBH6_9MYCO|nr:molybdopterin-dependent oxidoreductase [Mycolicibacterium sp. CAU 1645]
MTGVEHSDRRRWSLARAASGLLAAGVTLGVGVLVAAVVASAASPWMAVGGAVVDHSPFAVREWAIDTFGTNDKLALFVGMGLIIALLAAVAGLTETRRRPYGSMLFAGFGVVGAIAALTRPTATVWSAVPTVLGVAAGILTLRLLTSRASPTAEDHGTGVIQSRRAFVRMAGVAGVIAVAGVATGRYLGDRLRSLTGDMANFLVPTVETPAPPVTAAYEVGVPDMTSFITPNDAFYRIDTVLQIPAVTTDQWRLRIHGMVDREISLTFDDLYRRSAVDRVITLTCVSNQVGGNLVGNARWTGYLLTDLLAEAGLEPGADMLLSRSVDGFTASTPLAAILDGRDALLAVAMNGQPLPLEHGYPARLVVPGLYGYVSATKWVSELEITRFDKASAYWTERGWAAVAPIKISSSIEVPAGFARLKAGSVVVAGVAWAQQRGIGSVEVSVDDGPWQFATLAAEYSIDTWRQWYWEWDSTPGTHTLAVRCTDRLGQRQIVEQRPTVPDGSTGLERRVVFVE